MTFSPPQLTTADVRGWTSPSYYQRGLAYFQDGRVLDTRREGHVLKARCRGSRPSPYRIEVTLDEKGIASAWCSCPVPSADCKHVIAVLFTWIHEPEVFSPRETLEARLGRRSKQELVALIEQMIERHPDLERLIGLTETSGEGFDEEWIRDQIQQLARGSYGPEASNVVRGPDLHLIENLGHKYIEDDRWTAAARLFCAVADELLELFDEYPYLLDHAGGLLETVMEAADQIDTCLSHLTDPADRRTCFRALFSIYRWDTEFGGLGISDRVPEILTRHGSDEERALAAGWTREALEQSERGEKASSWQQQSYGYLLLELEGNQLEDEAFLQVCRETKRWSDLIDRLLEMGDLQRAVDAARELSDYELLEATGRFEAHGHAERVYPVVKRRAVDEADARLLAWLQSYAAGREKWDEALTYSRRLFERNRRNFDARRYRDIQTFAEQLGTWAAVRRELIDDLRANKTWRILTELYLEEGAVDEAIRAFENISTSGGRFYSEHALLGKVAHATETVYPDKALEMHVQWAEHLIDRRGRDNYREAAAYLAEANDRYRTMEHEEPFNHAVEALRGKHSRLPAMQDEFDKAGL